MATIAWSALRHAYGSAANIPALLEQAKTAAATDDYRAEPWYSLWSSLCHQGDVYTASYAAVPELVALAEARTDSIGIEALLLAASIELERHRPTSPAIPEDVRSRYDLALRTASVVAPRLLHAGSRPDDPRRVEIANAVFRGDVAQARHLLGEDDETVFE